MKLILISALVAAAVSLAAVALMDGRDEDDADGFDAAELDALAAALAARTTAAGSEVPALRYTMELVEDAWVDGARTSGSDNKPLAPTASSVCFLTRIEVRGIGSPMDSNACAITVDEFTGFWEVTATVPEGSRSEVRCNARCLVWEQEVIR